MTEPSPHKGSSSRAETPPVWHAGYPASPRCASTILFWLRHDLVAAIVLTTMLVPVGIACAVATGLPGETGVMTFIVSHNSDVYEKDLGPDTAQVAAAINVFNPDKSWDKADMTPEK